MPLHHIRNKIKYKSSSILWHLYNIILTPNLKHENKKIEKWNEMKINKVYYFFHSNRYIYE